MMLCLLFGCQKTQSKDGKTTSSDCQTNDTAPYSENVESESNNDTAVEDFLRMTYTEIKTNGITLPLSYYEGGGSPVYEIDEHEGLYLVFPSIQSGSQTGVSEKSMQDKLPIKLLLQSDGIEVYPGLKVGMTAEEVELFHITWEDIYEFRKRIILHFIYE